MKKIKSKKRCEGTSYDLVDEMTRAHQRFNRGVLVYPDWENNCEGYIKTPWDDEESAA